MSETIINLEKKYVLQPQCLHFEINDAYFLKTWFIIFLYKLLSTLPDYDQLSLSFNANYQGKVEPSYLQYVIRGSEAEIHTFKLNSASSLPKCQS